ncbi:MFS transporter [Thermosynechococcus sp. CL-1]|uniref:MFS transporter n=1 Tax=unclassified Thermosynechococcus TaxID=2622553 RepID=UPI00122DF3FE|nr:MULTISPECIES: MFS transporter [unclassified Thermosynechococcus]QEQ01329.1 MFS transporter [Thermosynechococcus sp. CL-1]WKT82776.1 MFS transporter [Thermosynechococcus sp. HY596]WNC61903.1 MFS transporter [Thermosynechococcus sp. HY591]WNC64457.1 MFS transporter [Thermosynechococcus sp. HY593]
MPLDPSSPNSAATSARSPLSLWTKLAFGAGDLGTAITANLQVFFLMVFLTNVAGLNAGLAGSVLMIGKIWDAINDPIIGYLSDRTPVGKWGRRHIWMILAALPFGICFFLNWWVPTTDQGLLFGYYVLMGLLFNTFYTAVNLPYSALTPELTEDYNERTSLNSFRFAFSIGGSIGSLLLAQILFQVIKEPKTQYIVLGGIAAVLSVLPIYWCVWGTRGRVREFERHTPSSGQSPLPLKTQLRLVFSNRPFLFVMGIYLCSWLAVQITASLIPFFIGDWLQMSPAEYTQVALAVQSTAMIMLFVWSAVSRRIGKKAVYYMGMALWMIAQAGLFLLQPGQTTLVYICAILAGFGVSTAYLVPWSMIPDVIDLDELNSGQRREGIFYAFMVLLQKIGLALGLFLVGQALQWAGYLSSVAGEPRPVQPPSALLAIRIAIGPLPTFFLIIGIVLAYLYPITQAVHQEILLRLHAKRQGEASA